MVIWRDIDILLLPLAPFYPIEVGFSPDLIEFYAENYYLIFITHFLNFLSDTKFRHHI